MTPAEAKITYIAALNAIIAGDPLAGPFFAQRAASKDVDEATALTNRINNTASDDVQAALKALRRVRV